MIVGGGIAGLVSAHHLRDRDPVVLEASDRVGGRIWSQQRGDLALSVGAHMFPPPDSVIGKIVGELGLEVMPITGSMLNIHLGGRIVRDVRPELLPLRLPLSAAGRVSFARAGLKVKRDADAYMKLLSRGPGETDADVRLRALKHRGDETFLDFLGNLQPDAFRIFEALSNRSLADPDEISQSAMSALFAHVWDTGDLGRNMRGGSGLLPDALGESLGPIVRLSTTVTSMSLDGAGVRIAYAGPDGAGEIRARTAIVAVPAPVLPGVLGDAITPEIRSALGDVTFGPMAVLSIRTDETTPMPWDDLYSVLTPDLRFNMFFNHANFMHGVGQKQGSVIMVYGGGRRARALLGASEDAVRDTFLADLDLMYPQVRRHIAETWVKVWEHAAVRRARALARAGGARPRHRRPHLPGRRLGLRVRLDGDRRADRGRRYRQRAPRARGRMTAAVQPGGFVNLQTPCARSWAVVAGAPQTRNAVSGRDAWRAEDLEPVVGGGPEHWPHVRRRRRGGRDLRCGRWGGERADEALESGRFRHQQEARLLGTDDERVRNVARAEHERAGARRDRRALDPDRELAIEDVEPLVLVVVDVQRRAATAGHELLGDHHATAGLGAVGLDGREAPEEPEVLSLAGPVGDGCEGVLRRAHRCASVVDRLHACSMSAVTRSHHPRARGDFGCAL